MSFEKRLCILRQLKKGFTADGGELSGAIYAERLGGELTLRPKISSLSPLREGRYAIAVWIGGETYCLELKGSEPIRIPQVPSLKDGFSALVCFVRGAAEPIAYGNCGGAPNQPELLLRIFSKREGKKSIPMPLPPTQTPVYPSPQVPLAPTVPLPGPEEDRPSDSRADPDIGREDCAASEAEARQAPEDQKYDDEAIASDNYFGGVWEAFENASQTGSQKETETPKDGCGPCAQGEDEGTRLFRLNRSGLTYYNEIAPKLKEAMSKFPRDDALTSIFPHSEWVRKGTALLGIIYAEGLPRFLCVAMRDPPPEEVKEKCVFVPVNHFTETEGYHVVFQDAETGEYVRVENS